MIKWSEAYSRLKDTPEFVQYFKRLMPMGQFRFLAFSQFFASVPGVATAGVFGIPVGPLAQTFPSGAVILGITAAAYEAQQLAAAASYAPSYSAGRRDLFGLSFQYTGGEFITPNGLTMAEPLLGSGYDTIFPAKEILVPPSQAILCAVGTLSPSTNPVLSVSVVYHCMVPREAN
jgi:hypothetical protein